jgi:hypothetical protein
LGEALAGLTVATFLCVFAFGFYISPHNYNYILPYTYAATYGMAFALWSLLFFMRTLEGKTGTVWPLLSLVLTASARWELAAALVLAMLLSTWNPGTRGQGPNQFKTTLSVVLPALGVSVLFYTFFFVLFVRGSEGTWEAIQAHLSFTGPFALGIMGLLDLGDNLIGLAFTLGLYAAFALFFFAGGRALVGMEKEQKDKTNPLLPWGVALFVAVPVLALFHYLFGAAAQYRCVPLLCLYLGWSAWRKDRRMPSPLGALRVTLAIFSLLVLVRILFKVALQQYGFTLLVPGLMVYYWFFLEELPSRSREPKVRNFVKGGFLCLSVLFIGTQVVTEEGWYDKSTLAVESPRGDLRFFPAEPALGCSKLLEFLRQDSVAGDSLAVFPEGAALNFLSGLPSPLADYVCNPVDLQPVGAQARVIDQLEKKKAAYVLWLQRDTSEYGRSSFGRDYAKDIMGYVLAHYSPIQQWGPFPYTTQFFGMVLLKRRSDKELVR